ncbi:MAG: hypothetical protein A3D39_01180 [Candidatus Buchananbacteria bacterium RIFCSPHIGHO2_02_FULL_39_17]|nr:MAG: hypothetical protein A3D39_01180 [Candidatus Buchananbacteria bacterium RIFCSPHIGHO2_02_FULL_39_17]
MTWQFIFEDMGERRIFQGNLFSELEPSSITHEVLDILLKDGFKQVEHSPNDNLLLSGHASGISELRGKVFCDLIPLLPKKIPAPALCSVAA